MFLPPPRKILPSPGKKSADAHAQIPKTKNNSQVSRVFFVLLGSSREKYACKTLVKLTSVKLNKRIDGRSKIDS